MGAGAGAEAEALEPVGRLCLVSWCGFVAALGLGSVSREEEGGKKRKGPRGYSVAEAEINTAGLGSHRSKLELTV